MSKKKHIHLIVPDRFAKPLGGMGVGARNFIKHLGDEYDFTVIGFPEENDIENYRGASNVLNQVQHGSLNTISGQSAYFYESSTAPKPDLIHAYDWTVYLGAYYAAKFHKVPLLVSMRLSANLLKDKGLTFAMNPNSNDGMWIDRTMCDMEIFGLKESDHITQVSESYAKQFDVVPGLREKTTVVPNGIDLEEWGNFKKVDLPGDRKIKLVYIGRFASMKGVINICESHIPDDIDLIFVGADQGGEQNIIEMIKQKSMQESNIHYIGPKYGQDKIDLLNSADAVIIPSMHEPFGIVALEALASKNILISSFVDGMSDFLSEDFAIKCNPEKHSIEQAMQKLTTLSDKDKKKMVDLGIEKCKEYSWKNSAAKMKKVYKDLIN